MDIINLFSTTLFYKHCFLDIESIEEQCYKFKGKVSSSTKSNIGGYQGHNFFCEELKKEILNSLPVRKDKPLKSIEIDMWVNINKTGDYNERHNHSPFSKYTLSGIFYVKTPERCGNIRFYDPRGILTTAKDLSYYNDSNTFQYYTPKENLMFMFPTWLDHQVEENKSTEDRISIAFNVSMEN